MNHEPVLVQRLNDIARDMAREARRHKATAIRREWEKASASTRLCAVLISEGVHGYDATVGYAWLRAGKDLLRKAS